MEIRLQLSVFLDNRPGVLAHLCSVLAKEGINILALSVSDTVDHAVVRMVTNDPKKAMAILAKSHLLVQEREVVFIEVPNVPGALGRIAEKLTGTGINIEYAYCAAVDGQKTGALVLRTSDIEGTINALS